MRLLLVLLCLLSVRPVRAAVFDFTPVNGGQVLADYLASPSRVRLQISGANVLDVPSGSTQPPLVNNGVVAWSSSSTVYYYVFDPARSNWFGGSSGVSAFAQDLSVVDGVVAWSTPAGAFFRVYDPARKNWVSGSEAGAVLSPGVLNGGGVAVALKSNGGSGYTVFYFTYDPASSAGWQRGSTSIPANTSDLTVADGVVAWSNNSGVAGTYNVSLAVYDPSLQPGRWQTRQVGGGFVSALIILNSTVSWSAGTESRVWGYSGNSHAWASGLPVPLAYFSVSTNSGNAPFTVSFIDMSIGANSWSWNFGDGGTSSRRSTFHQFTTFGRFTATLSVNNSASTATRVIVTDTVLPTGTLKINGAASGGFTTNRNVTLNLTASDTSLGALTMRLSNEGTNWTDWESFAVTRAWSLATNNGIRSVSAQFRDVALNTSATVSASIQLDTTPLPVATLSSTNLNENVGGADLVVTLDRVYSQPVILSYVTSNGTATAGSDYGLASGTLTFPVNTQTRSFTVGIVDDGAVELNETFFVHLTVVSNAIAGPPGTVTIIDNDPALVSLTSTNYIGIESNGVAVVSVQLSGPSGRAVSVRYATGLGTATPEVDYTPVQSVLVFLPGQTNRSIPISLADDFVDEYPETISFSLLGATNGTLSAPISCIVTIVDDDKPLVSFTQGVISALEPTNNASVVRLNVRLSKPFIEEVAVEVAVDGITATPGLDYFQPFSKARLTYNPGETDKEIDLTIFGDSTREFQETIRLTLVDLLRCNHGTFPFADVLITDDDGPPYMSGPVLGPNGLFTATFIGYPGHVFAVECSPNLSTWTQILRLTNTTGTLIFSEPISTNGLGQFYRTRLIP